MINFPQKEDLDLVALDLDGTVICPRGQVPVSERTLKAVEALRRAELPVTFVTGRTEDYAGPIAERFELDLPLVTYNGARLFCPRNSSILYQALLSNQVARELVRWLAPTGEVIAAYLNKDENLHLVQNRCSGRPAHDDYLFGTPRSIVGSLETELSKSEVTVTKMIVSTPRDLTSEVTERFGAVAQVVRTHPELVEVLPLGVTKGSGVERLCRHLQIDPARVLAVGDQDNDLSTFQVCGYSIAMGDAPEHVQEKADFVTGSFEEDGCAQALEKILYARR